MKIAYCEDEKIQKEILEESLGRWGKTDLIWYESAEQMLFECDGRYPFDLIILDIQMKKQKQQHLLQSKIDIRLSKKTSLMWQIISMLTGSVI